MVKQRKEEKLNVENLFLIDCDENGPEGFRKPSPAAAMRGSSLA
jgi:hypothetical protein